MAMPYHKKAQGIALTRLRKESGLTLRQVAAKTGINHASLGRKENSITGAKGPEISALLDVYGCPRARFDKMVREIERGLSAFERPSGIPVIGVVPGGILTVYWQTHDSVHATDEFLDRAHHPDDAVALRVQGESMSPRVEPGDKIICRPVDLDTDEFPLKHNDMVVISLGDDAAEPGTTLGYWTKIKGDGFAIRKENAAEFQPIPINTEHVVRVLRVVEIRKPVGGT